MTRSIYFFLNLTFMAAGNTALRPWASNIACDVFYFVKSLCLQKLSGITVFPAIKIVMMLSNTIIFSLKFVFFSEQKFTFYILLYLGQFG